MHIRPATADDLQALVVGNQSIAFETEKLALDPTTVQAGVQAVLNDATRGRYLVATDSQDAVIGMVLITYEWSDWRNQMMWWIQSVYVWPHARRHGVFKALLSQIESEAARADVSTLRLYAEVDNQQAHDTYRARGFVTDHYQVFEKDLN
jgi:GNAT superfamily N-acetyltransferase